MKKSFPWAVALMLLSSCNQGPKTFKIEATYDNGQTEVLESTMYNGDGEFYLTSGRTSGCLEYSKPPYSTIACGVRKFRVLSKQ